MKIIMKKITLSHHADELSCSRHLALGTIADELSNSTNYGPQNQI